MDAIQNDEKLEENEQTSYTYDDLLNLSFKVLLNTDYYEKSNNPAKIAARCTVFAESDMIHKAQIGYKKEDLIAGLCNAIVENYTNNFIRGRRIEDKIVFQGGVSRNNGVVESFKSKLNKDIHVDKDSHLLGALGIALIAKSESRGERISLNIKDIEYRIREYNRK